MLVTKQKISNGLLISFPFVPLWCCSVVFLKAALFFQNIVPDMLILGCIEEMHDFDMSVSLPNGHSGTVPITQICDVYTKALHRLAIEEEEEDGVEQVQIKTGFRNG